MYMCIYIYSFFVHSNICMNFDFVLDCGTITI